MRLPSSSRILLSSLFLKGVPFVQMHNRRRYQITEEINNSWIWDKSGKKGFVVTGLWMTLTEHPPHEKSLCPAPVYKDRHGILWGKGGWAFEQSLGGGLGRLLIILVKGESHHTDTHGSPPVTMSPPLLASWLVSQKFLIQTLARGGPAQREKLDNFPRVYITDDQVQWHLWNNLYLGCNVSLPLSFLFLDENRAIEHHLFFRFLNSHVANAFGASADSSWGTCLQMLMPHPQVGGPSLGKFLLCADGADRLARNHQGLPCSFGSL